ncbi:MULTISPECIES: hypothetical protein [Sphingobacterium]|uniref:hypothetical protein n=1 Tax=Sphingobacterium TaxID=28453 RepID=UPI00257E2665|nr:MULTISPECIES: hypothetical protein [Sphingobacterium]
MSGNNLKVTFKGNIQAAIGALQEDCATLERGDLAADCRMQALIQLEKSCTDLCILLKEFAGYQSDLLLGRSELQSLLATSALSEEARQIWMADQLAFYKVWIANVGFQLAGLKETCTLKIASRELLLLMRLLKDMELVEQGSLKQMLTFVCTSFRTVNQEHLSYESLRKKYSDLDRSSILKVRKLLTNMSERLSTY